MILRNATIKYKGYDPDKLSKGSHKRICCSCDGCGRVRWVTKQLYRNLCNGCSHKKQITLFCQQCNKKFGVCLSHKNQKCCSAKCSGLYFSKKYSGKNNHLYGKMGKNSIRFGKKHTAETRKKIGEAHKGELNYWFNHKISEEHKQKMKDNHADVSGDKNPNWQDGISGGKYCYKFNNQLKQQIRDKYNNCDYVSGLPQKYFNRKLDVHHIDYNKNQGCDGNKWKLIPLSRSNHTKTNFNRTFWNQLFIYSLEIDKWYYNGVI